MNSESKDFEKIMQRLTEITSTLESGELLNLLVSETAC